MSNPLTDFIGLTDQFGARVGELSVEFSGGVSSMLCRVPAEFITAIVHLLLVLSIFIVDLIINQGLFLEIAGSMYQMGLDYIYRYVNPLAVATVATAILFARMYIGDKITTDKKSGRINGYEMNYETFADESFRKKVGNQVGNTAVLLMVIILAMANPFLLLSKAFELISQFVATLAPGGAGVSPQVDGILVPVLQMVNFKGQLAQSCNEIWSSTLAAGGSIKNLACLTADQKDATTADVTTVLISIVSIAMIAGFAYFAWIILCRFTWMLYRMIIHIAVVPWRAALLIANPGSERHKLDAVKDHFLEAAKSLLWLLLTVLAAQALPALVFNGMGVAVRYQLPVVLQLLLASALLFAAGKGVNYFVGRKWQRGQDGKWKRVEDDGTTGWNDFRVNGGFGKTLSEVFAQANKDSAAELELSAAMISGAHTTVTAVQHRAQGGSSEGTAVATNPEMDAATSSVKLTSPQPTVKLSLSSSSAGGSSTASAGQERTTLGAESSGVASQSAAEFAAAAAASIVAEAMRSGVDWDGAADAGRAGTGTFADAAADAKGLGDLVAVPGRAASSDFIADQEGSRGSVVEEESAAAVSGTETAGFAALTEAGDPATAGRRMIEEYMDAVGQLGEDPAAAQPVALATPTGVVGESRAFDRISKVYDEPVVAPGANPSGSGVTGGSGEFISCTQRRVEWQEKKTLALVLGMTPKRVDSDRSEKRPDVIFYSSSDDGNNQVKFRDKNGFGDGI